jgi:hypothetical protein
MCRLLHCTPEELDRQDFYRLMNFWEIKGAFEQEKFLAARRAEQGRK